MSDEQISSERARKAAASANAVAIGAVALLAWWVVDDFVIPAARALGDASLVWQAKVARVGESSIAVLPIVLAYVATNRMRRALRGFADGEFFTPGPARAVAAAGEYAIEAVIAWVLVVPLLRSWVFDRPFDLHVEPLYLGMLVFALFVVAVGHILRVAAEIEADRDSIV